MRLYHGSNIVIDSINLAMCRPYKDFGLETTEEWAKFVMNNRNRIFENVTDSLCNRDNKYDIVISYFFKIILYFKNIYNRRTAINL